MYYLSPERKAAKSQSIFHFSLFIYSLCVSAPLRLCVLIYKRKSVSTPPGGGKGGGTLPWGGTGWATG